MRMGERVKVGIAATLAPGRTGYTDVQLECVQFRVPPKYLASKDSQMQLLTIILLPPSPSSPFLRPTSTSRISTCVARMFI